MRILSAEQIREVDAYTIEHEPIASIDLMERAAHACFQRIKEEVPTDAHVKIISGVGNNGGDGAVVARLLHNAGFEVTYVLVHISDKLSADHQTNYEKLLGLEIPVLDIRKEKDIPKFDPEDVLIDAIFGTGLSRPIKGIAADVVRAMNESEARVIAIDAPSGLFSEDNSKNEPELIVKANLTLTFQVPKLSFLFSSNAGYVGSWEVIDIGLDKERIEAFEQTDHLLEDGLVAPILRPRSKFSHKGKFGHALMVGGQKGTIGALVLAGKACMRSGVGLLTTRVPGCGYPIVQSVLPEGMCSSDEEEEFLSDGNIEGDYNVVGIGPGIGKRDETANMLKLVIQNSGGPLVIDADGINILGENPTWIPFIPKGSILTPHPKEFERLAGKNSSAYEQYSLQKEFAHKNNVYVVLKGAHTSIACPDGTVYFNNTGNPGMATGGSGDVLTGMITGILAQGYSSREASILGVYLHGLAGDLAMEHLGEEGMVAGDIIDHIPYAFQYLKSSLHSVS